MPDLSDQHDFSPVAERGRKDIEMNRYLKGLTLIFSILMILGGLTACSGKVAGIGGPRLPTGPGLWVSVDGAAFTQAGLNRGFPQLDFAEFDSTALVVRANSSLRTVYILSESEKDDPSNAPYPNNEEMALGLAFARISNSGQRYSRDFMSAKVVGTDNLGADKSRTEGRFDFTFSVPSGSPTGRYFLTPYQGLWFPLKLADAPPPPPAQ